MDHPKTLKPVSKAHFRKTTAMLVKSSKGFYVCTLMEHYWYYTTWDPQMRAVHGLETIYFKHKCITDPMVTPANAIV